jgi:hypothetical protein
MKSPLILAAVIVALCPPAVLAQQTQAPGLGEVMVTANRQNTRYAQADRPVVGLRRQADSMVIPVSISSDTRDEATRKKEIHTVLLSALSQASAAGLELVSGTVQIEPVTRENYQNLPFEWAGRADTSKVDLMVKARLDGSAASTRKKLLDFIGSVHGSGRATVETRGDAILTIVNPDQYREAIIKLVADDAQHSAALFGPNFTFSISGIDGQVSWSQVSSTEVFLYIPYRYAIVPK